MLWLRRAPALGRADILVVCTGNVCRSPYVAAVLRSALPELTIASAGTQAMVGTSPGEPVLRALAQRGIGTDDLAQARNLTAAMVRHADLIVTATRSHRLHVVSLDRSATGRCFTLKELARVLDPGGQALGIRGVTARAAAMAQIPDARDHDDDLDDPFGLDWLAYQQMAAEVDVALAVLTPALREGPPS